MEQWREIENFPYYEVSDLGRVRSYRVRGHRDRKRDVPKIMRIFSVKDYSCVTLTGVDDRQRVKTVHRLVTRAFLGLVLKAKKCVTITACVQTIGWRTFAMILTHPI